MAKKQTKKKNSKAFNEKFRRRVVPYRSIMVIGFAAIIVVALFIGYRSMLKKQEAYQESIDALSSEVDSLKASNDTLKKELKNMDTDSFKEKIARERLGMIGTDEILLKESDDGRIGRGAPEEITTEDAEDTSASEDSTDASETDSSTEDTSADQEITSESSAETTEEIINSEDSSVTTETSGDTTDEETVSSEDTTAENTYVENNN